MTTEQIASLVRNGLQWAAGGLGVAAFSNASVIQGVVGVVIALATLWHSYTSATAAAAAKGKSV